MYSGRESSVFPSEALAEKHAFTLLPKQRNCSLLRQRLGGWVVVDASEAGAECFLTFVNDPHGSRPFANTYFDRNAVLHVKGMPSRSEERPR